jgi:hypothetical protein
MKTRLKVTIILFVLCASLLAVNTSITPILANDTENAISACPAEPSCPQEPVCCKETCMDVSVVIADAHAVFMGEGVSGTGPLRWEGTVTFADGSELVWIAYADAAPSFVGPDADWSAFGAGMQGELEIFREEVELKNKCGDIVAVGYEQGIFNITSSEFNVAGELDVCGDAGPLTGQTVDKFYTTGLVWTDTCGAFHGEGCTLYLLADEPCPEEPECPEECPEEPACPDVCGPTVTSITGFAWFDVEACPNPDNRNTVIKQTCAYNLSKGIAVQFKHDWDVFGEGVNINTFNIVEFADGTWYLWGTNVLEFCGVSLSGYVTGIKTPDDQLFARYVDYGEDLLVIWDAAGSLVECNITGVIIEGCDVDGFACAWPDVTWRCASDVTPFTGWAEGAGPPEFGSLVGTVADLELVEGTRIHYDHTWNSSCWVNTTFGQGRIINTVNGLNNMTDGSSLMWGTHELTFDCITLTGTITGDRWLDETGT